MKKSLYTFFAIYILFSSNIIAQDKPLVPKAVGYGVFLGKTPPLKDLPAVTPEEIEFLKDKALKKAARKVIKPREYPFAATALPRGEDAAWQKTMGKTVLDKAPLVNFEGQTTSSFPPDCNGTIGPNHYMQTVNTTYAIYNRSGTLLAGPTNMNLLFNGVSGTNCNDGDPLIQYDEQAQRWVAVEFSLCGSNDLMLMAVSATSDPTGSWYAYSFDVTDTPDYEKLGIWQDGYYMGTNTGTGNDIYVFERAVMMAGGANPKMVAFDNAWRPGSGFLCVPPLDNDGAFAPAGSPGLFIAFNDDAVAGGSDQLWIYQLAVNWTTPASSTFVRSQQIPVTAFDSQFTSSWDDITQPGTQKLDGVPQVIMNAPQYRNFGTYQTILCCHTVDVDATNHAGIRWYELRKTPPSTTWVVRQSGTYAPDASSRWMGSIMLNGNGKIGLAYSIASSTIYPGIRYCGQSSAAYANATGVLDIPEEIIQNGSVSQTTYNRWGDYALLSVDPTDDNTFWFSSEYVKSGGTLKGTKIASFKFGNNPTASTLAATSIAATSATLNGNLNPNALATTYYFQWGTTVAYGNITPTISAGSGSAVVNVSANISGLSAGTIYHYRLVAVNADGTTNGNDMTFTVGVPILTTVAATNITTTTAVSGGNITSDGGSTITARGVCWSTTLNPTTANNKTTNGSGTGSFSSSITGLSANTTYHVRAYATSGAGTFYGDDLIFNTTCGIFTLPFSEAFTAITLPNCWTQIDNVGNGQIWQFGTITNQNPNPVLNANYAYLNSDAYGSGNTQNADLISPTLDLSSYSSVNLQFNHYFKSYTGSSGNLYYSIDNGSSWTLISTFTTTSVTNPTVFNQAVNAVAGQSSVKFKWNYTGTYGYSWAIDDISLTGVSNSLAIVTTTALTSITTTTAIGGGNVTNAGSTSVTARGICWGTVTGPVATGNHTSDGTGTGSFTSSLTGLLSSTTYFVRAYATNTSGTAYGNELSFTTSSGLPVLTTNAVTSVTNTTAVSGGNINSSGTSSVTVRGVCWATSANPVATGNHTSDGTGTGSFTSSLTGLLSSTTYFVRAYATNTSGTAYGNELSFTTSSGLAVLTTNAVTSVTNTTAISGGNISSAGTSVTARGVCWATSANPVVTGSHTSDGTGIGSFSSSITGLSANTTYHVRAYATNSSGTSYGDDIQFSTLCGTISTFPWNEGFENAGAIPACWSQEQVNSSGINWTFVAGNGGSNPAAAHTGSYNATLKDASTTDNITKLITPTLNLTSINNPQLSFWHTQQLWSPDQDLLFVYYKTSATGIWTLLTSYTNSITAWTQETITLPSPTSDYYIAFEGNAKYGYGVCVDDINVTGTGCVVPSAAGAISGTTSVCQGQTITYTVSPIANATTYVWTLPNGASGTSSTNSINVNYGASAISGNITVKGNNICGDGSASSLVVTVNSLPDAVGIISGNTFVCSGQIINYSVSPIANATSYVWTLPNGASGSSATNSIDVSFSVSATSGNITVKANNACGDGSFSSLPIVVGILPSAATAITGTASVCQGQNLTYTVSPIANATSYVWTLPGGANGTSTTNSIDVNFDATSASGNINVKGNNACGNGSASDLAITVNSLPDAAGIISGNEAVCKGQSLTYSVGAIANAASYTWNLPSGVSGNSVTNTIDVSYGVAAISGNILVNGSNICGDGSTSLLAVTVKNIPASANSISGLDTINQGQNNVIYSVSPIIDANTYIWTLPTNSVGNSVSSSIVLSFPDSSVSGNLIVKGQNECGVGEPSSKFINVFKSLEVKLFLEGLYIGNQQMQSALDETGTPQWGAGNADKIIIELRDSSLNFQSVFTDSNILLKTDGYAFNARITASNNGKYYIVAKNRNHIETWSAAPVSFSNDTTYYNFTTSADKAFGNNLKETAPDYVINLTAILADNTNNILELKSYAYNPLRYTLILLPESDNIHLKVIVIDKVLNKTYQTSVLKSDYLY